MEELRLMLDPLFYDDTVRDFLCRIDLNKNPVMRIVAWLISLGELMPLETTFEEYIYNIEHDYLYLLNSYWGDESVLLTDSLDPETKQEIKIHMGAKLVWFLERCKEQNISQKYQHEAIVFAHKIVPLTLLFDSTLMFFPTDSYLFYTVLLAVLAYASQSEITNVQIESLVFFIFRGIKYITNDLNKTTDVEYNEGRMTDLLMRVASQNPDLSEILMRNRDFMRSVRLWESTLFSSNHNSSETFVIWDFLIADVGNVMHRMLVITSAHLLQCESIIKSTDQYFPLIQSRNSWELNEIMSLSETLYGNPRVIDPVFTILSFGVAVSTVIVGIGSLFYRNKK